MLNALGYSRLSVEGTIETQNDAISYYCERNNLNLVKIFSDDGVSGGTFDRPGWIDLENFLKGKHNIKYVIVTNTDRFSRTDMLDAMLKMRQIETRCNIKILTIHDALDLDINDPTVRLIRMMQSFTNEQERLKTIERTKRWIHRRTSQGYFCNKAPFGYKNATNVEGDKIIVIDDEQSYIIKVIFSEFLKGVGIEELRKIVKPMGFNQAGRSAIQRILCNPVYAGMIKVNGFETHTEKIVDARHPGIISKQDFYLVQDKLNKKHPSTQNREEVPLRGVLKCFCGACLTAGNSRGKLGKYYWYYLCKKHKNNLSAVKLHAQFHELLDNLSLSPRMLTMVKDELTKKISDSLDKRSSEISSTNKDLKQIKKKISAIEEKYLLQVDVSPESYNKVVASLRSEESKLYKKLAQLNTNQQYYWDHLNQILPALGDIRTSFLDLSLHKQHQFINVVFDRSLYYADGSYRTPFILPLLRHNELILNEKRLLFIEKPSINFGSVPVRTPNETVVEPFDLLDEFFALFAA